MIMVQATPTVWQREVILPVGIAKEGNGSLLHQATIRKMTGKEEALLADPRLQTNSGKLITALLTNCVQELEGQPVREALIRQLSSADRNFLLLELRRLTFGDEMEASYRCPHCQALCQVIENLSEIEVFSADDSNSHTIQISLPDGYRDPDGNWQHEFAFRLPTGEDEEAAAGRRDPNPTRQQDALLARCLEKVGSLESKRIQAAGVRILSDLSMSDRRMLQKTIDAATPGPNLTRDLVCDSCGQRYRAALDMSHFFPMD